jgi:hypothetical protein
MTFVDYAITKVSHSNHHTILFLFPFPFLHFQPVSGRCDEAVTTAIVDYSLDYSLAKMPHSIFLCLAHYDIATMRYCRRQFPYLEIAPTITSVSGGAILA